MHPPEAAPPSFVTKLWKLVNERKYEDLIAWAPDGRSFTIKDQTRFAKELLPLYFKHNNMGSFVRQLNMYGFRKMANLENCGLLPESDEVSFHHPDFIRGQERLLQVIRRKKNAHPVSSAADPKSSNGNQSNTSQAVSMPGSANEVQSQIVALMQRQDSLDKFRLMIQQENAAIWKEIAFLRRQNNEQQNVIQNLIKFLISLVPQMRNMSGKRKASLISSMANSMPKSKRLNRGSQPPSPGPSQGMENFSMETIRNGIIDAIRNGLSSTSETGASNGVMIQDVTDGEITDDLPTASGSSIIAHSSSDSPPMLTESDMDLLSQICAELNLVPPVGKNGNNRTSDTIPANNIVEVPEDFILETGEEEVIAEDDLSALAGDVDQLLQTDAISAEGDDNQMPDLNNTGAKPLLHIDSPVASQIEQPLNDPLDLESLALEPEEFTLPDLNTPLIDDPDNSFSLLL